MLTALVFLFLAGPVQASVIYEFTTTDYTVSDPGGDFDGITLSMEISDSIYQAGFFRTPGTEPMLACFVNDLLGFAADGNPVSICPDDPAFPYTLLIHLDLQFAGTSMTGSFAAVWLDGTEAIFLDSQPSGLWSGEYGSDNAELGCWFEPCPVEGEWHLVSGPTPVPGPPSLMLLAAGLVGIAFLGRRKAV
ncbi:hypothetical protein [Rhodospirillaceae bacterium SYSU D60014]|uniref:hypothetical protein n=1 Tax=Virgifigura deserti TaxID=2268457 RepID=UPI0013C51B25